MVLQFALLVPENTCARHTNQSNATTHSEKPQAHAATKKSIKLSKDMTDNSYLIRTSIPRKNMATSDATGTISKDPYI